MEISKELFSTLAIIISFIAFVLYIRSTLQGVIRPHAFSWLIWGTTTCIVFFTQLQSHAGAGAWPTGVAACLSFFIAAFAYWHRGACSITHRDWAFLLAAMASLPMWFLTSDPLWAVIILSFVDVLGFGPTYRKAYVEPYSESPLFYSFDWLRNLLTLFALQTYTLTTVLFPLVIVIACSGLVAMIVYRRTQLSLGLNATN